MDTNYLFIVIMIIIIIALIVWLVLLKKKNVDNKGKMSKKEIVSRIPTKMENPGVPVALQAECTSMGRGGDCGGNNCCKCDDWEGDKCVPREYAKTACRTGKCDN